MLRIALTGGIATGKSYVARRLQAAGVPVVDADVLAREVVAPGTPGLAAIVARFGPEMLTPEGTLDRARLGRVVFSDPAARRDLEAIVHPAVRARIEAFFDALPEATPMAVADIPLLYEGGRERQFDKVIVAACPREVQLARITSRDHLSREDALGRIDAQLPIDEKVRRADYVIDTSGSHEQTNAQVEAVLNQLRPAAG